MSVLSANDWQKIAKPNPEQRVPDWRRFEKPSTAELVTAEERRVEEEERQIHEAVTALNDTSRKLAKIGREEVLNGQPDPWWETPADALDKSMSLDEAREFSREQSKLFRAAHPEYYACQENFEAIVNYLVVQRVPIATVACFERAVERLDSLNLLLAVPDAAPEPAPVEEPQETIEPTEAPRSALVDGWDIETGEPRQYTQREINQMSSDEFRRAMRMWAGKDEDRRPRFTRSVFQ